MAGDVLSEATWRFRMGIEGTAASRQLPSPFQAFVMQLQYKCNLFATRVPRGRLRR